MSNNGLLVNEENIKNIPLAHFSVSGLLEYMKNEYSFFDKYVLLNWNNTTGQPLMVGSAFHYALEQYYNFAAENVDNEEKKALTCEEVLAIAKSKLEAELDANYEAGLKDLATSKFDANLVAEFENLEAIFDQETGEFDKAKTNVQTKDFFINNGVSEEEFEAGKNKLIDWGKTQNPATAHAELEILVKNYFTREPYKPSEVLHVEANETAQITDLDGNVMPMPLKGKMDLIIRDENGKIVIIDHKTAKFFTENPEKAQYELQAGAYFFLAWAVTGERPSKMVFDEVIKSEQSIGKGLLKKDLVEIAKSNEKFARMFPNFENNFNVDEMKKLLLKEGLIEVSPVFNRVVVDFEENPQIVTAFLKIYKTILNRIAIMSLYDVPLEFLPNPFAEYSGEESWQTFKASLDTSKSWKDTLKELAENSKEEVEEFAL